jgi:hypothetical protein
MRTIRSFRSPTIETVSPRAVTIGSPRSGPSSRSRSDVRYSTIPAEIEVSAATVNVRMRNAASSSINLPSVPLDVALTNGAPAAEIAPRMSAATRTAASRAG